ncbi:TetR/AcrR family transcriptional regulator [Marinivivus vitaminiproducens]|uniref:TetR/AcrR family transcriptional regulator n=1 Tax=Marinivivus vitaminiproducens TaxID=3035935 RepID=UPI002799A60C|nr:TetR/AcrR family transcriptional regulator [Geminicoccaceae bacterium SCSIO 64248]
MHVMQRNKRPRGRPPTRTPEETRALVLESAAEVIADPAVSRSRIDAIASHAGISKRTLYELFGSKEELLAAFIRSRRDDLLHLTEAAPPADSGEVETILRRFLHAIARHVLSPVSVGTFRLVTATACTSPGLARSFQREGPGRSVEILSAWLGEQRDRGLLRLADPDTAAAMLLSMATAQPLRDAVLGLAPIPTPADAEAHADRALDLFLNGCRP